MASFSLVEIISSTESTCSRVEFQGTEFTSKLEGEAGYCALVDSAHRATNHISTWVSFTVAAY